MIKIVAMSASLALLAACNSGGETVATPEDGGNLTEETSAEESIEAPAAPAAAEAAEVIDGITNQRVSFSPGANSATVEASITGYETVDYLLNVKAGQAMNVSMATPSTAAYFNILEPGETDVAMHIGSVNGNQYEGLTSKSGDYRIRVYQMRSAARRNETATYRLEMIVG